MSFLTFCLRIMDENFRYFGRNIDKISDISDNRSEISHENSFEGKFVEKSEISSIFRRYIGIRPKFRQVKHTRVGDFLLQNIEDISEISIKYRRYVGNIDKNIENISGYIGYIFKWSNLKS